MSSFETLRLAHSSTVDRVVEELRRALFDGEVEPGTPLREKALAEAMGVSRSTIREALGAAGRRGAGHPRAQPRRARHRARPARRARRVRRPGGAGDRRRAPVGGRRADRPGRRCRAALRAFAEVAAGDPTPAELTAAHLAIHRSFVALTESARLVALAETLTAEIRLALAKVDRIRRNADAQVHSHETVVDLLERGEVEAAADELAHHLADAETSMLTALDLA